LTANVERSAKNAALRRRAKKKKQTENKFVDNKAFPNAASSFQKQINATLLGKRCQNIVFAVKILKSNLASKKRRSR